MRIVMLTSKLNFKTAGGSVMDLHLKAKGLVDLGHTVTVVTAFSDNNILDEVPPYRVVEEMNFHRGLFGTQSHGFRLLRKHEKDADAFYVDGQTFIYAAGLYRLLGGKAPAVAFFNARLNVWADMQNNVANPSLLKRVKKSLRRMLEHTLGVFLANKSDAFVFNTPHVQNMYTKWGFVEKKCSVIEDFVDTGGIINRHHISPETIKKHQTGPHVITFFSTGRMLREKGFELIVRAFAQIKDKEGYRVIISGDGPDRARIEQLAEELGVAKHFSFPGWVAKQDLAKLFLDSHVFIFPKWWMEYGSALLTEALAFGMPCIILGGGALEWLTEGKAAMFRPDDIEDLAKRMEELGADESRRIYLAENACARASVLDCRHLARRLAFVFETVAKQR